MEDSVATPQGPRKIPFDLAILLLGIYPKDYKSFYYKDTCTRMFIAALFMIAKTWNQPKCPSMMDWTRKMWHIYTMEYYAAIKKRQVRVLCRDMDESRNHHSQQTDTRTENQTPHVLSHRWVNNENTWAQERERQTPYLRVEGRRREGAEKNYWVLGLVPG